MKTFTHSISRGLDKLLRRIPGYGAWRREWRIAAELEQRLNPLSVRARARSHRQVAPVIMVIGFAAGAVIFFFLAPVMINPVVPILIGGIIGAAALSGFLGTWAIVSFALIQTILGLTFMTLVVLLNTLILSERLSQRTQSLLSLNKIISL